MHGGREKAERVLASLRGVRVQGLVPEDEYERTLSEADALLIAHHFDPASIGYIGYSLANKMPARPASWAPLLAYGPRRVATIPHLETQDTAKLRARKGGWALSAAPERTGAGAGKGCRRRRARPSHVRAALI